MIWYRFKEDINSAPPHEGYYYLAGSGRDSNILYTGQAQNMREAINNSPDKIAGQAVVYFSCQMNTNTSKEEYQAMLRENRPPGNPKPGFF